MTSQDASKIAKIAGSILADGGLSLLTNNKTEDAKITPKAMHLRFLIALVGGSAAAAAALFLGPLGILAIMWGFIGVPILLISWIVQSVKAANAKEAEESKTKGDIRSV